MNPFFLLLFLAHGFVSRKFLEYFWNKLIAENRVVREAAVPSHGSGESSLFEPFLADLCFYLFLKIQK